MKNTQNLNKNSETLRSLSSLPEKILRLHGAENVSEFVLYELCHPNCFNLPKAAFFIDNPDFNCFKGIAGFNKQEHPEHKTLWEEPERFTEFMKNNSFNQKVRNINHCSANKSAESHLTDIAHQLDVRDLGYHKFSLKHGNHGFLLYDKHDADLQDLEILSRGACVLGFCPVF